MKLTAFKKVRGGYVGFVEEFPAQIRKGARCVRLAPI